MNRRSIPYLLPLIFLLQFNGICGSGSDDIATPPKQDVDPCSGTLQNQTAHAIVRAGDRWLSQTPLAAGECTASYLLYFRWARLDRAANSATTNTPPPINYTFSPPAMTGQDVTPQKAPNFAAYPGTGWWKVAATPKPLDATVKGNQTQFTITVKPPDNAVADDSIEIIPFTWYYVSPN